MRSSLCALFLATALAACGGGGGGDSPSPPPPPPPPPGAGFTLGGTISVAPTSAVDSDTNDVNQSNYTVNDSPTSAQTVRVPLTLAGTVNEKSTGPAGRNFAPGDEDDWFVTNLVAGQVVELEFATDPAQADVDLFVILDDATARFGGSSQGETTRFECVRVTRTGRYYINVFAFRSASVYNMRIGAPGSAGNCANVTGDIPVAAGQLLAKAKPLSSAVASSTGARLQAAGVMGAQLADGEEALPHLLQLPDTAAGKARALSVLGGRDSGSTQMRRLNAATAEAAAAAPAESELVTLLKLAKQLQASGSFEYVQPNWIDRTLAIVGEFPPNDRNYSYQRWHYDQINLPAAMSRITQLPTQPTQRPLVAVIDDGVVLDHPDLQPQLFSQGRSFISRTVAGDGNSASGDNPAVPSDDPVFHGTHVAGTVGAATYDALGGAGTAPMAQILPLRVFPPKNGAAQVDVINAMLYAARLSNNSGLLPARRADVINLSLGGDRPCDAAYQDAVTRVRAAGVIVVAAAGNSGRNDIGQRAAVGSPANCNGVVAVSALDARKQVTRYSNTGSQIAVAAPGGDGSQSTTGSGAPDLVYSDLATFDANSRRQPSFGGLQGTSMASPHVAGVMALMRYVNPNLTVAQVDSLIINGTLTDELGAAGRDVDFGYGLINALKAVNAALAANTTPPPAGPVGRVVASPSSIDFGSFQSTATLDLALDAAGSEIVVSVTSDSGAVTVVPSNINATTKLGRYTVNVSRTGLAPGTIFPKLTVTLQPARTFTVQLSVTQPSAGGGGTGVGDLGPIYLLLINPATGNVEKSVQAVRGANGYTWSSSGWTLPNVQVAGGGDLDNDDLICQRGEPCGGYPVLSPGRDLSIIGITGNRNDLNFEVAPLSGISPQSVGTRRAPWRRNAAGAP
jgi:serine protease